jgi:hypothetical protein
MLGPCWEFKLQQKKGSQVRNSNGLEIVRQINFIGTSQWHILYES